ncbi:flagellin N-terminal helical domain-containing protein [Carnobacterium pleistocenium]|uniref:flagellin N-terminal helical domain-containing protein n=1 Tax=Carnobacterium pleistocenium TaxID=181073 RepID=UPI000556286A|nr:flagellin [Carnobacterium pleistocenium]
MRINTNTAAMNTYSNLTSANASKSNSLAKLSSGLRINKAGDDAAGLAISEKMKNQISGMTQASRNAQDGISLIQTAEGALGETHSILNRMRDLTVQSKNGTNTDEDTSAIQKEMDSLSSEIGRIAEDTQFNSKSLLNGGTEGSSFTFQIGANAGQEVGLDIKDMSTTGLGLSTSMSVGAKAALDLEKATEASDAATSAQTATAGNLTSATTNRTNAQAALDADPGNVTLTETRDATIIAEAEAKLLDDNAKEVKTTTTDTLTNATSYNTANSTNTELISVSKLKVANTVDTEGNVVGEKLTAADYDKVIETIDSAIKSVSEERANLGAVQNRLDHTVSNLATTKENLSEANSRITDVDMAEEMMSFTKSNILSQASTSMLAQANQMPQSVLSLLQ